MNGTIKVGGLGHVQQSKAPKTGGYGALNTIVKDARNAEAANSPS